MPVLFELSIAQCHIRSCLVGDQEFIIKLIVISKHPQAYHSDLTSSTPCLIYIGF